MWGKSCPSPVIFPWNFYPLWDNNFLTSKSSDLWVMKKRRKVTNTLCINSSFRVQTINSLCVLSKCAIGLLWCESIRIFDLADISISEISARRIVEAHCRPDVPAIAGDTIGFSWTKGFLTCSAESHDCPWKPEKNTFSDATLCSNQNELLEQLK